MRTRARGSVPYAAPSSKPRRRLTLAPNGHGGDATDELVMRVLADLSEPVTLTALQSHLRRHHHGPVGSLHARLELLALRGQVRKCWLLGQTAWGL